MVKILGYESKSLIILAGLDDSYKEEREAYFWKSIEELNLDVTKQDFENLVRSKIS